jgi:hypothetical protein
VVYFGGFFPELESSRGFLYIIFTGRISVAAMGGAGVGGQNMIYMTITELHCTFMDFFQNLNFRRFSLYNINFAGRNSEAAMAGES